MQIKQKFEINLQEIIYVIKLKINKIKYKSSKMVKRNKEMDVYK